MLDKWGKYFVKLEKMSWGYKKKLDKQHNCLGNRCWFCGFLKKTLDKWKDYFVGNR